MNIEQIEHIETFLKRRMEEPDNFVAPEAAITPDLVSLRMYDIPYVGVAAADDPLFERFRDPGVVGDHHLSPAEWLPGAQSVISFFLTFTERVTASNAATREWPSSEWLHARIEGQAFIRALSESLRRELERNGHEAVVPSYDPRFDSVRYYEGPHRFGGASFTSNWSERHAAYAAGLGTFGLSKGLITRAGMAGRFGSVVTTLALPPTPRAYSDPYEYCNMCGACVKMCPVGAITKEGGKDQKRCAEMVDTTKIHFAPRFGCGKCQVRVPCQSRAPGAKKEQPA